MLVPESLPDEKLTLNLSTAQPRRFKGQVRTRLLLQIPEQGIHIMLQRTGP